MGRPATVVAVTGSAPKHATTTSPLASRPAADRRPVSDRLPQQQHRHDQPGQPNSTIAEPIMVLSKPSRTVVV